MNDEEKIEKILEVIENNRPDLYEIRAVASLMVELSDHRPLVKQQSQNLLMLATNTLNIFNEMTNILKAPKKLLMP